VIQSFTQLQAIKKHLLKGKKITQLDALFDFQTMRLGARIWDLQQEPYNLPIEKEMIVTGPYGKRVAQYRINKDYIKKLKTKNHGRK
jgi:hypothetical protein